MNETTPTQFVDIIENRLANKLFAIETNLFYLQRQVSYTDNCGYRVALEEIATSLEQAKAIVQEMKDMKYN